MEESSNSSNSNSAALELDIYSSICVPSSASPSEVMADTAAAFILGGSRNSSSSSNSGLRDWGLGAGAAAGAAVAMRGVEDFRSAGGNEKEGNFEDDYFGGQLMGASLGDSRRAQVSERGFSEGNIRGLKQEHQKEEKQQAQAQAQAQAQIGKMQERVAQLEMECSSQARLVAALEEERRKLREVLERKEEEMQQMAEHIAQLEDIMRNQPSMASSRSENNNSFSEQRANFFAEADTMMQVARKENHEMREELDRERQKAREAESKMREMESNFTVDISKLVRERDQLKAQIVETYQRTQSELADSVARREEDFQALLMLERQTAYAEYQSSKAIAEARMAREQAEHWKSACRQAHEELARTNLQLEQLQSMSSLTRVEIGDPMRGKAPRKLLMDQQQIVEERPIVIDDGRNNKTKIVQEQSLLGSNWNRQQEVENGKQGNAFVQQEKGLSSSTSSAGIQAILREQEQILGSANRVNYDPDQGQARRRR